MAWPGNRVQEMVIAKLLLRLSLNNPSNVCHCSKEICHKNDREREREKRERASWMPMDMAIPLQCFVRISDKKLLHYYSGLLSPFTIVFWIQSNVPILKPSSLRSLNIDPTEKRLSCTENSPSRACPHQAHSHGEETLGTFLSDRKATGWETFGNDKFSATAYERGHGGNMFFFLIGI